jgi:hypothetical protein
MKSCHILAQKIEHRIADGFIVTDAVGCWLKTAFGIHDQKDFFIMNEAELDSQQASALDLIFFPDTPFQFGLEAFLQENGFSRSDELETIALLREMEPETRIVWGDVSIHILFPVELIENFMSRLHITRRLDERILSWLNQHLTDPTKTGCCVILRNQAIAWKDGHVRDMHRFMKSTQSDPVDFLTCFTDLLMFISEGDIGDDLYDGLKQKRQFWADCFHRAGEIQSRFQTSNAETMLMAGSRILSITPEEAMNKIEMLDRILFRMDM